MGIRSRKYVAMGEISRIEGRRAFGLDPIGYDRSRPEYPPAIFFWPAALSLIGQGPQRVFSLFASRIQPKFAAAPLPQSLTWCTSKGVEGYACISLGLVWEASLSRRPLC
jgi:hypothetical protein